MDMAGAAPLHMPLVLASFASAAAWRHPNTAHPLCPPSPPPQGSLDGYLPPVVASDASGRKRPFKRAFDQLVSSMHW